jgi:predicted transcriptional regulator
VHFQRLLREPPSTLVSALVDTDIEPVSVDAGLHAVSRYFATYNLVNAPVVDADHRLIGAITVDDVLDHALPADWRGNQLDAPIEEATGLNQAPDVRPLDEAVSSGQG